MLRIGWLLSRKKIDNFCVRVCGFRFFGEIQFAQVVVDHVIISPPNSKFFFAEMGRRVCEILASAKASYLSV